MKKFFSRLSFFTKRPFENDSYMDILNDQQAQTFKKFRKKIKYKNSEKFTKKSPLGGSNLFTNIDVYKNGDLVDSGGVCNHPILDTTGEYKNTSMFKEWVKILESHND